LEAVERATQAEIAIEYFRAQYTGEIIAFSLCTILFLSFATLLIYYFGLIPTVSAIAGILSSMLFTSRRRGGRAKSSAEMIALYIGTDDPACIELIKELSSKIEVTTPFYLALIGFTMIAEIMSPNKLNLEILSNSDALFGCTFGSWFASFLGSSLGDAFIFPAWRSMRTLEKFFKEHPIETLPPTIKRWWAREVAVKSGERPALVTGLSLFFHAIGIILFVGGLAMMVSGLIGFPIYEFEQLNLISKELTGLPLYGPGEDPLRAAVGAGLGLVTIGVFPLVSARWMWKLMKEGAIVAIMSCAIPIMFGIFFAIDSPGKVFNYLLVTIPVIIISLIKREWEKFM
jgi:hypothetical protein